MIIIIINKLFIIIYYTLYLFISYLFYGLNFEPCIFIHLLNDDITFDL
jgi:hypothetical protein